MGLDQNLGSVGNPSENSHHSRVLTFYRDFKGRTRASSLCVNVCARVDEELGHLCILGQDRDMERRVFVGPIADCVNVRPRVYKKLCHLGILSPYRDVERQVFLGPIADRVNVRASQDKNLRNHRIPFMYRYVEGRVFVGPVR